MQSSRTLREGSLGLFALLGLLIFGSLTVWLRGGGFAQRSYRLTIEFPDVQGLQVGAPVRFRGMSVGRIVGFIPKSDRIDVVAEISPAELPIPRDARVETDRSGLIGESAIEITPLSPLPPEAKNLDPLAKNCDRQLILCHDTRLQGRAGAQLVSGFNRLVETYTAPEFVNNLNEVTRSTSLAAKRLARLSDDTAVTVRQTGRELSRLSLDLSNTSRSLTGTAREAARFVTTLDGTLQENRARIARTLDNSSRLVENLNSLLVENRGQIASLLGDIDRAGQELVSLASKLNLTTATLNTNLETFDAKRVARDIETLLANAVETSNNLREATRTLNDPGTIVTLQKTLESARVTFENTQKITADVDEFLGDPRFRDNLRRLVKGLSELVSSAERLEYHLRLARGLDSMTRELAARGEVKVSPGPGASRGTERVDSGKGVE